MGGSDGWLMDKFNGLIRKNGMGLEKVYTVHDSKRRVSAHCRIEGKDVFIKWNDSLRPAALDYSLEKEFNALRQYSSKSPLFSRPIGFDGQFMRLEYHKDSLRLDTYLKKCEEPGQLESCLKRFFGDLADFYKKGVMDGSYDSRDFIRDIRQYKGRALNVRRPGLIRPIFSSLLFMSVKGKYQNTCRELRRLLDKKKSWPPRLIHGDLHEYNILVDVKRGDVKIIDLEDARAGHYLFDMSYLVSRILCNLSNRKRSLCLDLFAGSGDQVRGIDKEDINLFRYLVKFQVYLAVLNHDSMPLFDFPEWFRHKRAMLELADAI